MASSHSWVVSFSGAGHLLSYHLGVAKTLVSFVRSSNVQKHARPTTCIRAVAGSSSGAIAAAAVACIPDQLEEYTDRFLQDGGRAMANLQQMILDGGGHGLHEQPSPLSAPHLLGIATTKCCDGSLQMFSFSPTQRLEKPGRMLTAIQASCIIPRAFHPIDLFSSQELSYADEDGLLIDGEYYVDGGIAAPCPIFESIPATEATRIVVSPISGSSTSSPYSIRPRDNSFTIPFLGDVTARCGTFRVRPSVQNLQALLASAGAGGRPALLDWHERGVDDAHLFLDTWLESLLKGR